MPASRSCSSCGAPLPGDVRWCLRCHEPVRELMPRAPLHDGPHAVGMPIATGGNAPHWSRWERTATTFGPVGRLAWTAAFVASVLVAGANGVLVYVLMSPVVGWVLLSAIWAKGWVVPGEPHTVPPPDTPPEVAPTPPPTKAMVVWRRPSGSGR